MLHPAHPPGLPDAEEPGGRRRGRPRGRCRRRRGARVEARDSRGLLTYLWAVTVLAAPLVGLVTVQALGSGAPLAGPPARARRRTVQCHPHRRGDVADPGRPRRRGRRRDHRVEHLRVRPAAARPGLLPDRRAGGRAGDRLARAGPPVAPAAVQRRAVRPGLPRRPPGLRAGRRRAVHALARPARAAAAPGRARRRGLPAGQQRPGRRGRRRPDAHEALARAGAGHHLAADDLGAAAGPGPAGGASSAAGARCRSSCCSSRSWRCTTAGAPR